MAMQGADVDQLRKFAQELKSGSSQLRSLAGQLTGALTNAPWKGGDSDRFKGDWNSRYRADLMKASEQLQSAAKIVLQNADEQQQASDGATGGGTGGSGGPGGSSGPGGSAGPGGSKEPGGSQGPGEPGSPGESTGSGDPGSGGAKGDGNWSGESSADLWGARGSASGPSVSIENGKFDITLGKAEGEAWLARADASGKGSLGPVDVSGEAGIMLGAKGDAEASLNKDGLNIKASGEVGVIANAKGEADLGGVATAKAEAHGVAGAWAEGKAVVNAEGIDAKGEVGVGLKGSVEGSVEAGGVSLGGWADGYVGGAAKGEFNVGMGDDGKFRVKVGAGAAWGLGGGAGVNVAVDPVEVAKTVDNLAGGVTDFLKNPLRR